MNYVELVAKDDELCTRTAKVTTSSIEKTKYST